MEGANAGFGIRHVGIISQNIEQSVEFYTRFFNFVVKQDYVDDSAYINRITGLTNCRVRMVKMQLAGDGFILELLDYETHRQRIPEHPIHAIGACHLAIKVPDSAALYASLVDAGHAPLSTPILSSEGIAKVFFVLDPSRVRVEVVEMVNH